MEENKDNVITEEEIVNLPIQDTFNQDGLDVLVEEGSVENEYKD